MKAVEKLPQQIRSVDGQLRLFDIKGAPTAFEPCEFNGVHVRAGSIERLIEVASVELFGGLDAMVEAATLIARSDSI